MEALSDFFFNLYAKTIVLLTFLLVELILLIQNLKSHTTPAITISQYLQLIEEKNPTICYTNRRHKAEQGDCRVCLCEFEEGQQVRNLKCRHTFHKDCLDQWLLQCWATCPLCRNRVLPDDVVAKYRLQHRNQVDYDGNIVIDHDHEHPIMSFLFALRGAITLHRYL